MKVLVRGPALTRTGYGEHCRFVLRALRQNKNIDIYLIPLNWGQSTWVWEDTEERQWIDDLVRKTANYGRSGATYDASVQVTVPNEWELLAPVNIGITAGIETNKVSPVWLEKCNQMDKIITISNHSKNSFTQVFYDGIDKVSGKKTRLSCIKSVEVVHYPVKKFKELPELDLNISSKFNFLTVAQWGPRKNLENTIRWFVEEFIDNPDIGLIVKTHIRGGSILDRYGMVANVSSLLKKYQNRKCKVYLMHGDLSDEEMHSLYKNKDVHSLISLTHGEGFGLPLFEAAYSGLPVLATDWSGHLDFLYKPTENKKGKVKRKAFFAKVDYDLQPVQQGAVWDGVIQKDSMWAFPQQGSYKMKLREIYKDYDRYKSQAKKLQDWVVEEFNEEKQLNILNNSIFPSVTAENEENFDEDFIFEQVEL